MWRLDRSKSILLIFVVAFLVFSYWEEAKGVVGGSYAKEGSSFGEKCRLGKFDYDEAFSRRGVPGYFRKLDGDCGGGGVRYVFSYHDFWGWPGKGAFKDCPVSACVLENTTTKTRSIEEYDAVIFYHLNTSCPKKRSKKQRYIFFSLESPYHTDFSLPNASNFFNWTMTYRRDSDVHFPYSLITKSKTNYVLPSLEAIKKKTKLAAWFVSNCYSPGTKRRQDYVQELKKYIHVDIYGDCGSLTCPRGHKCLEMLQDNYFFYLSFENNMCFDYVTEKLFKVLDYDIIPVVMGYSHYDTIAPPNSVINVDDFPTPKALGEFLERVSSDPGTYMKYLEWKKDYVVVDREGSLRYSFCQLCDLLHRNLSSSSYVSVKDWFFGKNCYLYTGG